MDVTKNSVYVRGESYVMVLSDLGTVEVSLRSVHVQKKNAIELCKTEAEKMHRAIKKLNPKKYTTGGMSISANRQKSKSDDRYERTGPIESYNVDQSFNVVFNDIEKIKKFIGQVIKWIPADPQSTAVDVYKVYWSISEELQVEMENKCRTKAVEISRDRAQALIKPLGVELAGYPLYIVEDGAEVYGTKYPEHEVMALKCSESVDFNEDAKEEVEILEPKEIRVSLGATVCWGFNTHE